VLKRLRWTPLRSRQYPNTARGGWRVSLEFERIDARPPVGLRAFLRHGDNALSATWPYAIAPE
jgi:glucans biosynthesis protein